MNDQAPGSKKFMKIDYLRFENKKQFEDMVNTNPYQLNLDDQEGTRNQKGISSQKQVPKFSQNRRSLANFRSQTTFGVGPSDEVITAPVPLYRLPHLNSQIRSDTNPSPQQ
jgi:hypothetical protein